MNEAIVDVLNDLIRINNDRIRGYQKAIEETQGLSIDLKAMFNNFIEESGNFKNTLENKVVELGGTPAHDSTGKGKIYRVWMDIKSTFTGDDRHSILALCEYGEDAAQKAYNEALSEISESDTNIRELISSQQSALKKAHDTVKKYRDINEPVRK